MRVSVSPIGLRNGRIYTALTPKLLTDTLGIKHATSRARGACTCPLYQLAYELSAYIRTYQLSRYIIVPGGFLFKKNLVLGPKTPIPIRQSIRADFVEILGLDSQNAKNKTFYHMCT